MSSLAMASLAMAAPGRENMEKRATPTVYLVGDSTMALGGGGSGTQGWGVYVPYSLTGVTVVNKAVAGRSARSYTDEGRFSSLATLVKSGDFVIIEFGHNDGGSLSTDNGRSDCPGSGSETCTTAAGLVVQTYVTYLTNAAKLYTAKGAKVIISSPTPDNPCESGTCSYTPSRFTDYCKIVVQNVGNGSSFVDHGLYVANRFEALGVAETDAFYPVDHTHTSPAGADSVAGQFIKAALCSNSPLDHYIKNSTASVVGTCV